MNKQQIDLTINNSPLELQDKDLCKQVLIENNYSHGGVALVIAFLVSKVDLMETRAQINAQEIDVYQKVISLLKQPPTTVQ